MTLRIVIKLHTLSKHVCYLSASFINYYFSVVMLHVFMLTTVIMSTVTLSVIMQSVAMLNNVTIRVVTLSAIIQCCYAVS